MIIPRYLSCFLLVFCCGLPVRADDPIDSLITRSLERWYAPGTAVVIVRSDVPDDIRTFGVIRHGGTDPITPETLFPLASCTKGFTTTLMAMLADERKLRWDDQPRRHLPSFRLADPLADREVTLRDLVSHRTGVGSHDMLWYHAPWSTEEMVRRVGRLPADASFRAKFQYQSVMFTAAGLAVARTGGKPWDVLVRERIFRPLGMTGAGCRTTEAPVERRAVGHRRTDDGTITPTDWYEQPEPNPAGSIHASPRDLGPWLRFHLNRGQVDGRRLCSEANLRETHSPQMIIPMQGINRTMNPDTTQLSYGMGWVVQDYRGRLMHAHAGWIEGFRVQLTLFPNDQLGVAILTNLHGTRMNQALTWKLADHLLGLESVRDWDALFAGLAKEERDVERAFFAKLERERAPDAKPTLKTSEYVGTYRHPAYGEAQITQREGELFWTWGRFACKLKHHHFDTFRPDDYLLFDEMGKMVEFRLGSSGTVEGFEMFGVLFKKGIDD